MSVGADSRPGGRRRSDHEIAPAVLLKLEPVIRCPGADVLDHRLL